MKRIVLLLTCFSSVAMAESQLSQAVTKVQNTVNIEEVANALVCAENGSHCSTMRLPKWGTRKYSIQIQVLKEALIATEVYTPEDLARISNGIELLKARQ